MKILGTQNWVKEIDWYPWKAEILVKIIVNKHVEPSLHMYVHKYTIVIKILSIWNKGDILKALKKFILITKSWYKDPFRRGVEGF